MDDLKGKVILVTGATEGIGKAAATEFAKRGATVTIVGRNAEKTAKLQSELRAISGKNEVNSIICDLSRIADVRRAAEQFERENERLDVLVNNAGAVFRKPVLGPDGYELTFALNHLAYFELTRSLLGLLTANTNGARVVSTASAMQASGKIEIDRIAKDVQRSGMRAYSDSKLANVLFTKELQRRLQGSSVTANCLHPGVVHTGFGAYGGSDLGMVLNIAFKLSTPFLKTPEQGADTLIWLATAKEAQSLRGEYVTNRRPARPQKQALDAKLATDLWTLSEELCAKVA